MPKQEKSIKSTIRAKITKVMSWIAGVSLGSVVALIVVIFVGLALFARTDTFQDWLRDRVLEAAQETLDIEISYETAELKVFKFFPELNFVNVRLNDSRTETSVQIDRVGVSISLFVSLPMLLFDKIYISEARVEGLSYELTDLAILEDWQSRLQPRSGTEGEVNLRFETVVHRIAFRDFSLQVDLPVDEEWVDRVQASFLLDRFNIRIDRDEFFFEGAMSFSRMDLGNFVFHEGRVNVRDSFYSAAILRLGHFQLQTADDFIEVAGDIAFGEYVRFNLESIVRLKLENYVEGIPIEGAVHSEAVITGPMNNLKGRGQVTVEGLQWQSKRWDRLRSAWTLDDRNFSVSSFRWNAGRERGSLKGVVSVDDWLNPRWELELEAADFGAYLGLAEEALGTYGGDVNLRASGVGIPLLNPSARMELQSEVRSLAIRGDKGEDIYTTEVADVDVQGQHQDDYFFISGGVTTNFGTLPVDLRLNQEGMRIQLDAELDTLEAGRLFDFDLQVVGPFSFRLYGPYRHIELEIVPSLELFSLNQMGFRNVTGNVHLAARRMRATNLRADGVELDGALYFQKGPAPTLFEDLNFELSGVNLERIFESFNSNAKGILQLKGDVSGKGQLRGSLNHPSGEGNVSISDLSVVGDRVQGRQFQADWQMEDLALRLSRVRAQLSRDGGIVEGALNLSPEMEVGSFDLKGNRIRLADWFALVEVDPPFHSLASFHFVHRLEENELSLEGRFVETSIGAGLLPDSRLQVRSRNGEVEGTARLLQGQVGASVRRSSNGLRLEVLANNLQTPSLIRILQRTNLRLDLNGRGVCDVSFEDRAGYASEFDWVFNGASDSNCEFGFERSRVLRGNIELHQIDPFRVQVVSRPGSSRRVEFDPVNVRTGQESLSLRGHYRSADDFMWRLNGASSLDTASYFIPFLNRSDGLLRVDGQWNPSGFQGLVELDDGVLFFQDSPIVIRGVTARLVSQNSQFELRSLSGRLREGELRASGGFRLDGLDVNWADIGIQLDGTLIEPQTGLRFRLDGPLKLAIEEGQALLSGDLNLHEGSFRRRMNVRTDLLRAFQPRQRQYRFFEQRESYLDSWRLDIALNSAEPFVVRNNIAEGEADLNLRVVGSLARPNVQGGVNVRHGRFTYFNRTFEMQSGAIQFTDSQTNIPRYDIRAQTQVAEYVVFVNLIGDAEDQRIIYSSDPPLNERSILALVSYGVPPVREDEFREEDPTTQAAFAGISFVTGQIQDTLEGALATDFGIQRFQLYPAYFDETGRTELQLKVGTDLIRNRLELNYLNFVTAEGGHQVELDFRLNRTVSLVGSWREIRQAREQQNISGDFGGDIIFRFEFD